MNIINKFLLLALVFTLSNCRKEINISNNPCDDKISFEVVKPQSSGLSWVQYKLNDSLTFTNGKGQKAIFVVDVYGEYVENPKKEIQVTCSTDPKKTSVLEFAEAYYNTNIVLISGAPVGIIGFSILLERYLKYSDPRIYRFADILEIGCFSKKDIDGSNHFEALSFPVLTQEYVLPYEDFKRNGDVYTSTDGRLPFRLEFMKDRGIISFTDLNGDLWQR